MRVSIRNGIVRSDTFSDNIMEDCNIKNVNLDKCENFRNIIEKLGEEKVLYNYSMHDWCIDQYGELKHPSECANHVDSEGIALVLYFKFIDDVKKYKKESKDRMQKVINMMEKELYDGREIESNGISLTIKTNPGTVAFNATVNNIDKSVYPLYSSKIKDQNVLEFCLDRESGFDPSEAINFNSYSEDVHDVSIYYSVESEKFIIY